MQWPHADFPSLEDVIDTMQKIRRQRKGINEMYVNVYTGSMRCTLFQGHHHFIYDCFSKLILI